ncbi:MAG: GIN domain-containing protein [Bacteroidota bacterium]
MKKLITPLLLLLTLAAFGQDKQQKERPLDPFQKIVVSPKIKLVLKKGETESIRVTAANIDASQLNIVVRGNKLHIYLDDARYIEKSKKVWEDGYSRRRSQYHNASVTAYVTYRSLKGVEIRGEERLVCDEMLETRKFKLKAYGRTRVELAEVKTDKFKAVMYGENTLRIEAGVTGHQKYTLYGENTIETSGVTSKTAATTVYGEGTVAMQVSDEVRLNAFGEPMIWVEGPAHLSKGLVFGRVGIRTRL